MVFNRRRFQTTEHAIAVLSESAEVAIELLIPVGEGAELGQMFHLIDVARTEAAAIGLLQGDQIEVAQQVADLCRLPERPLCGSRCCQLRVR